MSQADTLQNNTQQIADDIGTLYEPAPIAFSFEAPGWTYLLWTAIIVFLFIAFQHFRKYQKNRYRRDALKALNANSTNSITEVFVVLKQTAMHAFGRDAAGHLSGTEWLTFLDAKSRHVNFTKHADEISAVLYQEAELAPATMKSIISNAQTWIRTHVPS